MRFWGFGFLGRSGYPRWQLDVQSVQQCELPVSDDVQSKELWSGEASGVYGGGQERAIGTCFFTLTASQSGRCSGWGGWEGLGAGMDGKGGWGC